MWIFFEIFFFKILGLTNYKGAKKKVEHEAGVGMFPY
jgi:hypothetical protein